MAHPPEIQWIYITKLIHTQKCVKLASLHHNRGGGWVSPPRGPPLGNFLKGQAHPNVFVFCLSSNQVFLFLWHEVFCVCFPVVQGFSLRLLCLFSKKFQFKFFIYSLYIHIYIFYIFCHCTVGSLVCAEWFLWDVAPGLIVQHTLCTYTELFEVYINGFSLASWWWTGCPKQTIAI